MPSQAVAHYPAHLLDDHLEGVTRLARQFALNFGPSWAAQEGHWHDLGKHRPGFQHYITHVGLEDAHIENKVPGHEKTHSAAGALWALQTLGEQHGLRGRMAGKILAYLIAGHHAGLADWHGNLKARLEKQDSAIELQESIALAPPEVLATLPEFKADLTQIPGGSAGFSLWVRMLFSALVDADFLDTEAYMDGTRAQQRKGFPSLEKMGQAFDAYMDRISRQAAATQVNTLRTEILRQCRDKASLPPGLFSLTVPTGGGKTLSSLAFALRHAQTYGNRRIIYAIPYTSIIEQTADVFRDVFADLGEEVLVEHHSQADGDETQETSRSRVACENWDAPLIVTTNVQLFESLFAAKTSRCRKLHNLVGSIIILDEAQQLPPEFLQPILDALNLLVHYYGVSVVLCTATQPTLSSTRHFEASQNLRGLQNVREIMDDPDALYEKLKRVTIRPATGDLLHPTTWEQVAEATAAEDCVLVIVNTHKAARTLHALMPAGTLHLSALMCGAHRAAVIEQIKLRLKARREGRDTSALRVVSTQLVEAGVDLDFPVVWRALAGLDSIAQAAGRCNREGTLGTGGGKVIVFVPPEPLPRGQLRKAGQACVSALYGITDEIPLTRELFSKYFHEFYASIQLDHHKICDLLRLNADSLNEGKVLQGLLSQDIPPHLRTQAEAKLDEQFAIDFRSAADRFKLIEDADQAAVVVRYADKSDEINKWLNTLKKEGPQRWLMRRLQRYIINIRLARANALLGKGLEMPVSGLFVQEADTLYDAQTGFIDEEVPFAPEINAL